MSQLSNMQLGKGAYYCIYKDSVPLAMYDEDLKCWVDFKHGLPMPQYAHIDPYRVEVEDVPMPDVDDDYIRMSNDYLKWLMENTDDDEVRELAEAEYVRRKDHYQERD
jgi:hypothetical protein